MSVAAFISQEFRISNESLNFYQDGQRPRRRRPQQRRRRYRGPRQDGGDGGGEHTKEQPEVRIQVSRSLL